MGLCGVQVAKLRAYHYTAQTKLEKAGLARYGLDLIKGALRNNVEAGVLEPVLAKLKIIQVSPVEPTKPEQTPAPFAHACLQGINCLAFSGLSHDHDKQS